MGKIKAYFKTHKLAAEIIRFVIVGGFATIIDMFVMGVVMYAFQPEIYPHFHDVFFNSDIKPSSISTVIGTGSGFIAGLIFNYFLSVFFVFEEKGESKTVKGFLLFTVFPGITQKHQICTGFLLLKCYNDNKRNIAFFQILLSQEEQ